MNQFKVGDLVESIDYVDRAGPLDSGLIYTIEKVDDYGYVNLKELGDFVYYKPTLFKPYKKPEEIPKPKFKVGDIVECIDADGSNGKLELGKIYEAERSNNCFIYLKGLYEGEGFYNTRFKLAEELNKPQSFKVGDLVEWCGTRGVVERVDEGASYPIRVKFESETYNFFTKDGRYASWHKTPSLVLISRPKKMVTKTVEAWANIYPDGEFIIHIAEEHAIGAAQNNKIACVKLTGTYEIEEDEI